MRGRRREKRARGGLVDVQRKEESMTKPAHSCGWCTRRCIEGEDAVDAHCFPHSPSPFSFILRMGNQFHLKDGNISVAFNDCRRAAIRLLILNVAAAKPDLAVDNQRAFSGDSLPKLPATTCAYIARQMT